MSKAAVAEPTEAPRPRLTTRIPAKHGAATKWSGLPPTPDLPPTPQLSTVPLNGAELFFARFGDPGHPPVLFLHGGMGSSNYWGRQVEHLADRFHVIVMDTRGHGRSPVTSPAFSYRVFAQDVVALLDLLKIPKAAIVGWSDGAVTGLQLAVTRPDRVSRLFAFGGNSALDGMIPNGGRSRTFVEYGNRCRKEYETLSPYPKRWQQLVEGLRVMWRTQPNFSADALRAIKVPTTIADGEHDEIIQRSDTERMHHEIRGAHLAILPGVSHFAMLQDPAQFNAALDVFLQDDARQPD